MMRKTGIGVPLAACGLAAVALGATLVLARSATEEQAAPPAAAAATLVDDGWEVRTDAPPPADAIELPSDGTRSELWILLVDDEGGLVRRMAGTRERFPELWRRLDAEVLPDEVIVGVYTVSRAALNGLPAEDLELLEDHLVEPAVLGPCGFFKAVAMRRACAPKVALAGIGGAVGGNPCTFAGYGFVITCVATGANVNCAFTGPLACPNTANSPVAACPCVGLGGMRCLVFCL